MRKPWEVEQEIKRLEEELEKVNSENTEYNNLTYNQKIAVYLHSTFCHTNHEDGCSWEYSKLADFRYEPKQTWLNEANCLISFLASLPTDIPDVATAIKNGTIGGKVRLHNESSN